VVIRTLLERGNQLLILSNTLAMQRKHNQIPDRRFIDTLLERSRIGRLATTGADGYPYITPVNYVYLNGSIYFHCARTGEKLDNIRRDPRVCFQVDQPLAYLDLGFADNRQKPCSVTQFYDCVIIRGRAEISQDIAEKVAALNALVSSHQDVQQSFREITEQTRAVSLCEIIAVRVESISGKSERGQKKCREERALIAKYLKQRNMAGDFYAAGLVSPDSE
jgi:nitroimidazol reductase NimA-like FMN-containing flavoprotein (pyridoxamine 5'-phosphate oxidase superfamily)